MQEISQLRLWARYCPRYCYDDARTGDCSFFLVGQNGRGLQQKNYVLSPLN